MIKKLLTVLILLISCNNLILLAGEGMWLPYLIGVQNIDEMNEMGLKLSAEDIFSSKNVSLKDAVVLFDNRCTGEVISDSGLIVTNYHCAYSNLQALSTVDNDYMTNGFWAKSMEEEIPVNGLTVSFLISVDDVSEKVLENIDINLDENERLRIINKRIDSIKTMANESEYSKARIVPFYYGNEYYMFVYEVFKDIRLVGVPPGAIGRFGGDTDNWVWPRHTGDFSLFRIYADTDNNPVNYSPGNIPYKPKKHLHISLKGHNEGDFTMALGYPGRTYQYLTSHAIDMLNDMILPKKIEFRKERQKLIRAGMEYDGVTKIKYAAKLERMSNALKKWTGILEGFRKINIIQRKEELERQFKKWSGTDSTLSIKYGTFGSEFKQLYDELLPFYAAEQFLYETVLSIELIDFVSLFDDLMYLSEDDSLEADNQIIENLKEETDKFFRDYNAAIDEKIFARMLEYYYYNVDYEFHPEIMDAIFKKTKGDFTEYSEYIYSKSLFVDKEKVDKMLQNFSRASVAKIEDDPAFQVYTSFTDAYKQKVKPPLNATYDRLNNIYRKYVYGLIEMEQHRQFYPDANHTLRLSYGNIKSYKPEDAVTYRYYTSLSGVIEKSYFENKDYAVPERLKELYEKKDFGRYGTDSIMPICFIATNHTSGGSSGSPVLNASGQLIGINFDRNWEGTMSDYIYDVSICRNISLDVRYMLFIIDRFAGAGRLLNEMTIVY